MSTTLGARASACGLCFALRFASVKSSASRALRVKAPDFAFAKLRACKAKQQPNRNPQLDNQNLTKMVFVIALKVLKLSLMRVAPWDYIYRMREANGGAREPLLATFG